MAGWRCRGEQIQDLLSIIQSGEFASGQGKVDKDTDMINRHMSAIASMVEIDRPLKVVLDAGNGLSGSYMPDVAAQARCRGGVSVL